MRNDAELLQAALTALEVWSQRDPNTLPIVEEIRARMAEPEDEPVAWANFDGDTMKLISCSQHPEDRATWANPIPLYRHTPRPVRLSDEELQEIAVSDEFLLYCDQDEFNEIARAIESAIWRKTND